MNSDIAKHDFFQHKAASYETVDHRVTNVDNIANAMIQQLDFTAVNHIMDFGSGTGLLLERIAPYVGKITAVDVSESMNAQLDTKREQLSCHLDIIATDVSHQALAQQFDGIISSMTLHHIDDIPKLLTQLAVMLVDGGFIALADLDTEDGRFHTDDTGVFHHGFDRQTLARQVAAAGFDNIHVSDASVVHKPQGDYPVFLLTATV